MSFVSSVRQKMKLKKEWMTVGLGVILVDQVSKVIAGKLGLLLLNRGGVLGWGRSGWWVVGGVLVLVLLGRLIGSTQEKLRIKFMYWMILVAGFSNLVDRLVLGGVRDWICYPVISVCGNLADVVIVGSVVILGYWQVKEVYGSSI